MNLTELFVCFTCFIAVAVLLTLLTLLVSRLSKPKQQANIRPFEDDDDNLISLTDRILSIRALFAGLPSDHWPRVLARLYRDLQEQSKISENERAALDDALRTIVPETPQQHDPFASAPVTMSTQAKTPTTGTTPPSSPFATPSKLRPSPLPVEMPAIGIPVDVKSDSNVDQASQPPVAFPAPRQISDRPTPSSPAPWEMPDPEPRKPRQTLAEWSQSFMEERNIRWGELASGILIVGSAMGLVLSLRRELQDTIPYFPALLFLLISFAVYAAGVYTLQRWRLRSTSRGLLLISLLLVPLNFLAGVLFNADSDSQRPLTDPWLWIAVVTGTAGLGWITWSSSHLLLRKGQWALFVPLLTVGLGVVVINRLPAALEDNYRGWSFLPLTVAVAVSFAYLGWQLSRRTRASAHTSTRVWIVTGISLFALGTAYALYIMKQPDNPQLISTLAPPSSVWVLALLWLLACQHRLLHSPVLLTHRVIGMLIAGVLVFALVALAAWTVRCPRDLLLISIIYVVAALASASYFRRYFFVPVGVACLIVAMLIGRGLISGLVTFQDLLSLPQIADLFVNGRAAISFLLAGGALAAATSLLKQHFNEKAIKRRWPDYTSDKPTARQIQLWNSLASVAFVATGGLVAIIGAYRPTADQWDSLIGTGLLFCVALFVMGTAVWGGYRQRGTTALTLVGVLLLMAASLEAAFGNRYLAPLWEEAGFGPLLRAGLASLVTVALSLTAAFWQQWRPQVRVTAADGSETIEETGPLVHFSGAAILVGHLGLGVSLFALWREVFSIPNVVIGSLLTIVTLAAATIHPRHRQGWFESVSLLGTVFLVGLFFQDRPELESQIGSGLSAYSLAAALAAWCVVVTMLAHFQWLDSPKASILHRLPTLREFVCAIVPILLVMMVGVGLIDSIQREIWAVNPTLFVPSWQMSEVVTLATAVLVAWSLLLLGRVVLEEKEKSALWSMSSLECLAIAAVLYTCAWAVQGSRWDVDLRAASAIRWSVALGALTLAILPWCWPSLRTRWPLQVVDAADQDTPLSSNRFAFWTDGKMRGAIFTTSLFSSVATVFVITAMAVAGLLLVGPQVRGLSLQETWLGKMRADASYGIPVALILATVLLHSISQQKRWIVMAGSYLLRLIVAFQIVLLVLSPHPQLATEWFVHIVQMVSAGMTIYGWIWFVTRERCQTPFTVEKIWQPIQTHTLFNGGLLAGLMCLVIGKYCSQPTQPLGWIQAAGNLVGLTTVVLYLPLFWLALLRGSGRRLFVPLALVAVVVATMVVVNVEKWWTLPAGEAFVILGWSWVVIAIVFAVSHGWQPLPTRLSRRFPLMHVGQPQGLKSVNWSVSTGNFLVSRRWDLPFVWTLLSFLIVAFSWQGFRHLPADYWHFFGMHALLLLIGVTLGSIRQSILVPYWLMPLASVLLIRFFYNPQQFFVPNFLEHSPSLHLTFYMLIGTAWMLGYLVRRNVLRILNDRSAISFGRFALYLSLVNLGFLLLVNRTHLLATTDLILLGTVTVYLVAAVWCDRERWRVTPWALYLLISVGALTTWLASLSEIGVRYREIALLLASGIVVLAWGATVRYFPLLRLWLRQLRVPRLEARHRANAFWLPIYAAVTSGCMLFLLVLVQIFSMDRLERQLSCFAPLWAAMGFVWFANSRGHQWHRYVAIGLFTSTALLLSWTQVPADGRQSWGWLVQSYWVTGLGFLAYGFGVAHWLRHADSWQVAVKRSATALLLLATGCLASLLFVEVNFWLSNIPQLAMVAQAGLIFGMTVALAISLVVIALVPRFQAVAMSMSMRQGYVYAAQLFLAAAIVHAALTLPWLFRFGLQQYWPYIAMLLAFGGIGIWHLLQRRQLTVLADPLSTTLLFFPAVAAALSLGLESETDRSMVMLLCGMVYGSLALTHPGFWTRLAAFGFGNLALWLFIERYPLLSFQSHPQLWLIPPAVTALVISRVEQTRLGNGPATAMRYLALAVIYVSSTSEIFIQGLGKSLAPPMILATLAVLGMLAGMALKIREYIFLGALFLLVAMFTMVSHAQQQLNHVWPWWAFGITLGIATLVFFGIFEQRRNQQRRQQEILQRKDSGS